MTKGDTREKKENVEIESFKKKKMNENKIDFQKGEKIHKHLILFVLNCLPPESLF